MKKRMLRDIEVSEVGMGCMAFSHGYGQIPAEQYSIEAIKNAYKHGCTFFDTAEVYSPNLSGIGHNERIVGKALKDIRKNVVIATKLMLHGLHFGSVYKTIRRHLEGSLERLQTDYADIRNGGCKRRRLIREGEQMDIFEKLKSGEPVDMMSEEYRPAIKELMRADKALFHLNHAEPGSAEQSKAFDELFDGTKPETLRIMTPAQIDFPKQIVFGGNVFINHSFTAMSIGGIEIGDNVQIGPHVTIVTDNHDLNNRYVLKCEKVVLGKNVWVGAGVSIMPGVHVGDNAVIAGGAVVTKDVPANTVVGGNPAKVLRTL